MKVGEEMYVSPIALVVEHFVVHSQRETRMTLTYMTHRATAVTLSSKKPSRYYPPLSSRPLYLTNQNHRSSSTETTLADAVPQ